MVVLGVDMIVLIVVFVPLSLRAFGYLDHPFTPQLALDDGDELRPSPETAAGHRYDPRVDLVL